MAAAFLQGVTADGAARTVPVTGSAAKAAFRTRDAKRARRRRAGRRRSPCRCPSTAGPAFADAAARLSGTLLRPGDTFSFNGRVGAVTGSAARLATATWNAGFLAGLTDVARTASPTYTDGLPEGRDAMVDASTDLQMRNDSSYGVLLVGPRHPGLAGQPRLGGRRRLVDQGVGRHRDHRGPVRRHPADHRGRRRPRLRRPAPARTGSRSTWSASFTRVGDPTPVRSDTVTTTYQPEQAVVCQAAPPPV